MSKTLKDLAERASNLGYFVEKESRAVYLVTRIDGQLRRVYDDCIVVCHGLGELRCHIAALKEFAEWEASQEASA